MRLRNWVTALVLAGAVLAPARAGDTRGSMRLTVVDGDGKPVAGAKVHLEYKERERGDYTDDLVSDERGVVLRAGLQPFLYKMTVSKDGYQTFETEVKIRLGITEKVTATLNLLKPAAPVLPVPANTDTATADRLQSAYADAKAQMDVEDWEGALEAIEPAMRDVEEIPFEVYFLRLAALMRLERWKDALDAAGQALAKDPGNAPCIELQAQALDRLGRKAEAVLAYESVLEINPSAIDLHYRIARIAFDDDEYAKCISHLDTLLAAKPDTSEALRMKGYAEIRLGHIPEARAAFSRYLELTPDASDKPQIQAILSNF